MQSKEKYLEQTEIKVKNLLSELFEIGYKVAKEVLGN